MDIPLCKDLVDNEEPTKAEKFAIMQCKGILQIHRESAFQQTVKMEESAAKKG